jgi:predicted dehydrogenase
MKYFPRATILVEKPAADNLWDARWLLGENHDGRQISVALHMAFAPEVAWGERLVRAGAYDLGMPVSIESWSADPYQADLGSAESRLSNSWVDSGINALSVIERFAHPVERRSLRRLGDASQSTFEGIFECETEGGLIEAMVLTSWKATDGARSTRIRYSSGAELTMDHHAVAGYLTVNGIVAEVFGSDSTIPRRESHYHAMYNWWLVDNRPIFPPATNLRLHDLLLKPIDRL